MKTGDAVLVSRGYNKFAAIITSFEVKECVEFAWLWSLNEINKDCIGLVATAGLELLPDGPRKVGILSAYESHNRLTLAHEKHCEELARKCKEEKDEILKQLSDKFPYVTAANMAEIVKFYDSLLAESNYQ